MRGHQNQEFSSEIRVESSGGHGFRASGSSKSIVFAPRCREPSYLGLFSIYESFWSWLSPRGCLDGTLEHQKEEKNFCCVGHCSCEALNFGRP